MTFSAFNFSSRLHRQIDTFKSLSQRMMDYGTGLQTRTVRVNG